MYNILNFKKNRQKKFLFFFNDNCLITLTINITFKAMASVQ